VCRDLVANTHARTMTPLAAVQLLAPITRPNSIRDFIAFEDHARAGAKRRNEELNPIWGERPLYYKGNHRSIIGPNADIERPSFTKELDLEMEVAAIVATNTKDVSVDEAAGSIFGFTIMNDWSARDVQRSEMATRLGPAKSKDFATSLGPCIVTADEFDDLSTNPRLHMAVRVNGKLICEANLGDAHWSFAQMISFVSQGETVWPTDIYGSGTPFGGCILDSGGPWLEPGDIVEIEVEKLGLLRNTIA
ncbi:MAG: fumarylacetoacetate hydrolase family protein, partial [Actinomycetota bacterium]